MASHFKASVGCCCCTQQGVVAIQYVHVILLVLLSLTVCHQSLLIQTKAHSCVWLSGQLRGSKWQHTQILVYRPTSARNTGANFSSSSLNDLSCFRKLSATLEQLFSVSELISANIHFNCCRCSFFWVSLSSFLKYLLTRRKTIINNFCETTTK